MRRLVIVFLLFGCIAAVPQIVAAAHTQVRLLLAAESARPGETVMGALVLKMEPKWHTYWRNPGESGGATRARWELPAGISAGELQWPAPERYVVSGVTTYVYHDEAVLIVPFQIATNTPPGVQELKARVDWLECEEQCIPGKTTVSARLVIGNEAKASANAAFIEKARARLAPVRPGNDFLAGWESGPATEARNLVITWPLAGAAAEVDFYPYEAEGFTASVTNTVLARGPAAARLRLEVRKDGERWPDKITGLAISRERAGAAPVIQEVTATIASNAPAGETTVGSASAPVQPTRSVAWMLLFAFIGGLILNVMPCVLPVIALKVLGFVQQSKQSPASVRQHGLVYAVGVLCSFLVLAGVVIGVQQAGRLASWGMQFGNPTFVVIMATLVTLVALNLFGLFEVVLGGNAMGAATELAGKEGTAGAFFNGVLATALATPCTAPFLGAALGFAFSQPPAIVVLVFLTVGAGLALPYVLLSWNPKWMKFLPKPGAWMERFKIAMGFPMLATAVWLGFDVGAAHFGGKVFWLGVFLVILALAAWIYGEFVQRGRKRQGLARGLALVLVAFAYFYILEGQLHWRKPATPRAELNSEHKAGGIRWQAWSPQAVAEARAQGRVVFVDFTADWCVTCQANKKTSIEIAPVEAQLKALNAVALLGDYTLTPDIITQELRKFGRAGVPLVLVYPADAAKPPEVLPELLTPGIVLGALERARR